MGGQNRREYAEGVFRCPRITPKSNCIDVGVELGLCKLTFEHRRKMLRVSLRRLLEAGEQTGAVRRPPDHFLTMRPEQLAPAQWLELARSIFGDSLGDDGSSAAAEGGVAEADAPVLILQRAAVNKAWKAHKAGYKDKDKE